MEDIKKLKIAILEDNNIHLRRIINNIDKISIDLNLECSLTVSSSIGEYREKIAYNSFDIYFLDLEIDSDRYIGISIGEQIREKDKEAVIIFVTTYSETMPLIFKRHIMAYDFIVKDQSEQDFFMQLKECLKNVSVLKKPEKEDKAIYYSYKGRGGALINFDNILFIETYYLSHRILITTKYNKKIIYGTIKDILNIDINNALYKINRSQVINIKNIIDIDFINNSIIFTKDIKYKLPLNVLKRIHRIWINSLK